MVRTPPDYCTTTPLSYAFRQWVLDRQCLGRSPRTITSYEATARFSLWWTRYEASLPDEASSLAADTVRRFLCYCRAPHDSGRWGRDHPAARRAAPESARHHRRNLRAFCRWAVAEELLPADPMIPVSTPSVPTRQREPLTSDEAHRLLAGARKSAYPERDAAVCLLLLDTGLRAAELCLLTAGDAVAPEMCAEVVGKRKKHRVVFWSAETGKALRRYLRRCRSVDPDAPLFMTRTGRGFTAANVHEIGSGPVKWCRKVRATGW